MTAALLERPVAIGEQQALHGGVTLEERLNAALREAAAHGSTECPVCHARMTSTRGAVTAECGGCGSRLS